MPVMGNGRQLWVNTALVTVAGSPLLSPWIDVQGLTRVLPWFVFAGGTSTHSIQGSFDGVTADADFNYSAPTLATEFNIVSPYIRWSTVQTVGDATKAKVVLLGRS